ncbi:FHA domain-containing protein [Phormidium tenue FACHB-886]|nr:FHA domain-containing protein [Phormidium tenue FACHB-886]
MPINPCRNSQCEFFNKSLPSTAKNCPYCGQPLGSAFPPPADPVPLAAPPPVSFNAGAQPVYSPPKSPSYSPPQPQYSTQPASRPVLKLLHSTGREFVLNGESGIIGRRGQSSPTAPEIDLSGIPSEGVVSRAHARVYWDASQFSYMLVDNGSRNGTLLNNASLQPGTPYPLRQGMTLQLGQDGLVRFTVVV